MTFQLPEFRHDDGKVLVYTDAYVSHRSQPRKAKSVYSLSLDEAGILFNGLKTVLQEHYETPNGPLRLMATGTSRSIRFGRVSTKTDRVGLLEVSRAVSGKTPMA